MRVARSYVLDRLEGQQTWYLWQTGNGGEKKYVLYTGDNPVELVKRLFTVPGDKEVTNAA